MRSLLKLAGLGVIAAGFGLAPNHVQARSTGLTSSAAPGWSLAGAERHPHMRKALNQLRAARNQLAASAHDYGGHRVTALGDVDQAITEIEAGLAWDAQHEQKGTSKPARGK